MKHFYRKFLTLALPVVLQNLIISGFHFVDNIMVGQLGTASVAGVALAGQIFFIMMLILFGICSGVSVLTAQYWGKRDEIRIRQTTGVALFLSLILALVFVALGTFIPRQVIGIFTTDQDVIKAGSEYLRLVCLGYPFMAMTMNLSVIMRSIERVRMPVVVYAITLSLNGFLNWVLIFGKLGFPKLGVNGAALATTFSRMVELALFVFLIRVTKNPLHGRFRDYIPESWKQIGRIIKETTPVILNEAFWGVGVSVFSVIFARISTEAVASFQIAMRVADLYFVLLIGMSSACATMIGNSIGAGERELAYRYGKRFMIIAVIAGAVIGLFVAASAFPVPYFYKISESARILVRQFLFIYAAILMFKSGNLHLIVGILRSGGDTKVAMLLDTLGVWAVAIPLGLLGAFVFHWPVPVVYILLCVEEVFKLVYGFFRFRSRKWIRDVTQIIEPTAPLALYPQE
jgi:putative MATE family efflux protein